MRLAGGGEKWMALLPLAALAILVTVYVGGPERAIDLLQRFVYGLWEQSLLLFRR